MKKETFTQYLEIGAGLSDINTRSYNSFRPKNSLGIEVESFTYFKKIMWLALYFRNLMLCVLSRVQYCKLSCKCCEHSFVRSCAHFLQYIEVLTYL